MDSKNDSAIGTEVENRLDDLFGDGTIQGNKLEQKGTLEVDRRLDDFFGDGDNKNPGEKKSGAVSGNAKPASVESSENSPLKDLKSVVLSLEWEISEQVMQRLEEETAKLEKKCKEDKIVVAFLQLLGSLGKYIRKKQADAHPDSIGLINSVYENLEQVMLSEGMADAEKKKMLISEVNKYKKLKEHIASAKPFVPKPRTEEKPVEKMVPRVAEEAPVVSAPLRSISLSEDEDDVPSDVSSLTHQDIISALEQINTTLKAEFKALREELKLWRENQ